MNIILLILACFIVGLIIGAYIGKTSFVRHEDRWSIAIYKGNTPFNFYSPQNIDNPVLTFKDVKDVKAKFVADPFMVKEGPNWYMFFEVMNAQRGRGEIGLAVSEDGINWDYKQVVLRERFHLAYPYVFKWKDSYYMIPESHKAKSLRLYKAIEFPFKWEFVGNLLHGIFKDSSIFRFKDKWWLFTEISPRGYGTLSFYYADDLRGPWIEHPKSPIIRGNPHTARPGGRVLVLNDQIIRYAQDDSPSYGNKVRAFEVTELSPFEYAEKEVEESPILKPAKAGWNAGGMHHIDPYPIDRDEWLACVDGYEKVLVSSIR